MSIRGNTSGEYFGEWFGPVEQSPIGSMTANLTGAGTISGNATGYLNEVVTGGGRLWQKLSVEAYLERVALRKQLEEEVEEPIKEVIEARSKMPVESAEADERAIRAAAEAARIEWDALYMRLLASLREEMRQEEEAIVMTMIAALSR